MSTGTIGVGAAPSPSGTLREGRFDDSCPVHGLAPASGHRAGDLGCSPRSRNSLDHESQRSSDAGLGNRPDCSVNLEARRLVQIDAVLGWNEGG
jgi:hypothetical protein